MPSPFYIPETDMDDDNKLCACRYGDFLLGIGKKNNNVWVRVRTSGGEERYIPARML